MEFLIRGTELATFYQQNEYAWRKFWCLKKLICAMPIHKLRKFPFFLIFSNLVSSNWKFHNPLDKYYLQIRSMMTWPTRLPKGILKGFVSIYYKIKGPRCYITSDALNFVVNTTVLILCLLRNLMHQTLHDSQIWDLFLNSCLIFWKKYSKASRYTASSLTMHVFE